MFREEYLSQINKTILEVKQFKENDFSLETRAKPRNDSNYEYILEITYRFQPEFRLYAYMVLSRLVEREDVSINISVCPGIMFKNEKISEISPSNLIKQIKEWLNRIQAELASIPAQREIAEQREQLQSVLEQLQSLPDEYFSREEGEQLRVKLEELEQKLIDNLQKNVDNEVLLKQEVDAITNDMIVLKNDIQVLSKRGWAGAFVARTFEWLKNPGNAKLLSSGAKIAKELLTEASDHLKNGQ